MRQRVRRQPALSPAAASAWLPRQWRRPPSIHGPLVMRSPSSCLPCVAHPNPTTPTTAVNSGHLRSAPHACSSECVNSTTTPSRHLQVLEARHFESGSSNSHVMLAPTCGDRPRVDRGHCGNRAASPSPACPSTSRRMTTVRKNPPRCWAAPPPAGVQHRGDRCSP